MGASDVLLPIQYFGAMGDGGLRSEQRLMLAVLADAISILQDRNPMATVRKRKAFAAAAKWVIMMGTHDLFSFDSICDVLGIGSEMARKRLRGIADGHKTDSIGFGHPRLKQFNRPQKIVALRDAALPCRT
jgi:hypothetical protein